MVYHHCLRVPMLIRFDVLWPEPLPQHLGSYSGSGWMPSTPSTGTLLSPFLHQSMFQFDLCVWLVASFW
jgi:hypothetical protein